MLGLMTADNHKKIKILKDGVDYKAVIEQVKDDNKDTQVMPRKKPESLYYPPEIPTIDNGWENRLFAVG